MTPDHMGWMWLWWLVGIALLAAIVWAIARAAAPSAEQESPEAILKRRYARGEISDDEFERRLSQLRK